MLSVLKLQSVLFEIIKFKFQVLIFEPRLPLEIMGLFIIARVNYQPYWKRLVLVKSEITIIWQMRNVCSKKINQ